MGREALIANLLEDATDAFVNKDYERLGLICGTSSPALDALASRTRMLAAIACIAQSHPVFPTGTATSVCPHHLLLPRQPVVHQ